MIREKAPLDQLFNIFTHQLGKANTTCIPGATSILNKIAEPQGAGANRPKTCLVTTDSQILRKRTPQNLLAENRGHIVQNIAEQDVIHRISSQPHKLKRDRTSRSVYSGQQNDERSQYRDVVDTARELNIYALDQREAGPRGRENRFKKQHRSQSPNTEIPHKRTQYHLSSKRGNPPPPVAQDSSDGSGYNSRIGNPQLVYRSGYPANVENDHSSPPAFASPPHQNSNLLGYSNIPAEFAHPSQSNASLLARSEQHHPPMNQGEALRPLSGASASRLVPTEKDSELGPARKTRTNDASQHYTSLGNVVEVKHSERNSG
ncbi:hypothetical protein RJ035_007475 [Blastomyces gilchristii]